VLLQRRPDVRLRPRLLLDPRHHSRHHEQGTSSSFSSITFIPPLTLAHSSLWLGGVVYLSNKAQGGVVYGQYTTAKACSYAWSNDGGLDTALSRGILAKYHKPPSYLIAIINWLPM
jgi:hypothetical protein